MGGIGDHTLIPALPASRHLVMSGRASVRADPTVALALVACAWLRGDDADLR